MLQIRSARLSVAMVVFIFVLGGCSAESNLTTSTATTSPEPPTPLPSETTTTSADVGPQPVVSGRLAAEGDYVTTVFEATTVRYRIWRDHLLRLFQSSRVTGLESVTNDANASDYRGVAVHGFWFGLTPEEVRTQFDEIEQIELGGSTFTQVGGFPAERIEIEVVRPTFLWGTLGPSGSDLIRDWPVQVGPLEIIIVRTSAGTLFITIAAPAEEWDEFLPVADEILAGISFPDLNSG